MTISRALAAAWIGLSFALLSIAPASASFCVIIIDVVNTCDPPVLVPEPSTLAVLAAGLIGLAAIRRSMKK